MNQLRAYFSRFIEGQRPGVASMHASVRLVLVTATTLLLASGGGGAVATGADSTKIARSSVSELIEQLGSESYASRVRAKEALQRVGLEAFDQLHSAQYHPDSEIAMSARFLISSLLVSWSKVSDPEEVRETLLEYGGCSESERSSRIDRLAEFPNRIGLPALVRVTSYERLLRLSRRAAIALMQQPMESDPADRRRSSEQILDVLGDNQRQAAEWLRAYAEDLASGEYSSKRWEELIAEQRREIDAAATQQSSRESVLELVRVCATRAASMGQRKEAIRLATENIDLIPPTSSGLEDSCSWAIDNGLHPFVLELRTQHAPMFNRRPILLYGAAEAQQVAGNDTQADLLASQASEINPLPASEAERAEMQPKELEDKAKAHREIGNKLAERGLHHWAEREFRLIIDSLDVDSPPAASARSDLAQLLADKERHQDVVDVLKPLIERLEKDGKLKQKLFAMSMFDFARIRSLSLFHEGLAKIKDGKPDEARYKLIRALQLDRPNVDILIAMYRLDGDEPWRAEVKDALKQAVERIDREVRRYRDEARRFGLRDNDMLAHELNNYAWLVSNTEGDQAKALRYSLESLELRMDGAKMDTCARCYFANGDVENAIRMQKRAIKLMPHSPPLLRQLDLFEAAQEAKDVQDTPPVEQTEQKEQTEQTEQKAPTP